LPVSQEVIDSMHATASEVVARAVAIAHERAPGLAVSSSMPPTGAVLALDAESADAQLLVVGVHGHRGLTGSPFGSVTSAVLDGARCPVMVAPLPAV
jgi:nucleotide-binding universal stress UspA family protein